MKASQGRIEKLSMDQLDSLKTVAYLSQKLNESQFQALELQGRLLKENVGDGSKPFLNFWAFKLGNNYQIEFIIENLGTYPIHDLNIEVTDGYNINGRVSSPFTTNLNTQQIYPEKKNFTLNVLPGKKRERFYISRFPAIYKDLEFYVTVSWSQGTYSANMKLKGGDSIRILEGKIDFYDSREIPVKNLEKFFLPNFK